MPESMRFDERLEDRGRRQHGGRGRFSSSAGRHGDGHHADDRLHVPVVDLLPVDVQGRGGGDDSSAAGQVWNARTAKNAVILVVEKGAAERPARVYKGNTADPSAAVDSGDLQALEDEITSYVEQEATRHRKEYVLIKAAEDVKHRDVARVARAASRVAEIQQLHVAVLEVQ